jgi:hypothetical protein
MDTGMSMDMRLFREYCSNHGPSALTEQIESDPAWSRSEITAEQRSVYLDRVIAQGINSLFEGYLRSNQNRNNMHPTPTPTGSIADSGVVLGSQFSPGETTHQEGSPNQPPGMGVLRHQPAVGNDRVQGYSTMQESAVEPSQSHGENLHDMSLDFSCQNQLYDSGLLTFEQFESFEDYSSSGR